MQIDYGFGLVAVYFYRATRVYNGTVLPLIMPLLVLEHPTVTVVLKPISRSGSLDKETSYKQPERRNLE